MFIRFLSIFLCLCSFGSHAAMNSNTENSIPASSEKSHRIQLIKLPNIDIQKIIDVFYMAVETNQLEVLDIPVARNLVTPIQVEVVYQLTNQAPVIRILSEIKPALAVPNIKNMFINKVSTIMDLSGNIVESTAHCEM